MRRSDLDFHLPPELIAQAPLPDRSASRLLHYRRSDNQIAHHVFSDLPALLRRGDLLVFNDARVLPARFMLRKETGGLIEGLFLAQPSPTKWRVLLRNLGAYRGPLAFVEAELHATIAEVGPGGECTLAVETYETAPAVLSRIGRMPLPPYIKRDRGRDARDDADRERYQTVYASAPGAVAAPTAGLHFTPELLAQLDSGGVERTFVTLQVGLGTFKPVEVEELSEHVMHRETYSISDTSADALNRAKRDGRRIVAIGTTAARVLESQPPGANFVPRTGETGIFIFPPYAWKHVDAMVTNFHLPRSTLIALVAAMVGLDEQRRTYREAIEHRYRFFSYGDAMLIE
ncbi:MAG TPA: tRNA preQ1(34) S-adenosylmethionine ribosyltransferase-isomerase QueA [Tepidisphaeraceae bacterium]|nr:tRNA preQ1(34) S-adenosylmethionine ribosyltransferase-isomerase QueA [Tepidisphaeraceae bacterium]